MSYGSAIVLLRCLTESAGFSLFCFATSLRARRRLCLAARGVGKRERERGRRRKNEVLFVRSECALSSNARRKKVKRKEKKLFLSFSSSSFLPSSTRAASRLNIEQQKADCTSLLQVTFCLYINLETKNKTKKQNNTEDLWKQGSICLLSLALSRPPEKK